MYLTKEQEALLEGEGGDAKKLAMEILTALGDVYGAERLTSVSSVHISGTSYTSCGDAGIDFLSRLVSQGARFAVPTTLNPIAIPLNNWRRLGFPEELASKQLTILTLYRKLGAADAVTCCPYLSGNLPCYSSRISWAESSAVVYANSVLGARTNREGGLAALASALTGLAPLYGLYLDENRAPTMLVKVEAELESDLGFSLLGYAVGRELSDGGVPLIEGLPSSLGVEELKSMGASMATSGPIAMFHASGRTPEAQAYRRSELPKVSLDRRSLSEALDELSSTGGGEVDCVAIGCPHLSLEEARRISALLEGVRVKEGVRLWVFTSEAIAHLAEQAGYLQVVEEAGGEVLLGGCIVHAPLKELGIRRLVTNSAKAAYYCASLHGVEVCLAPLHECLKAARVGAWPP
ncbi:MAG: aconitase X catalytic domain-containing protein [Candidatus Nezhaarchaeota archaeon]|nr:aconitase X catalytic domain-containing protein [Candidatus Nezhaarchaeota archaeon]